MTYPQIDPVFFQIGRLQFRWYGLMYILGFLCSYFIAVRISKHKGYGLTKNDIEDLLSYSIAGLIIGARLGYCLFYNFSYYIAHPLKCFAVWEGGMSFHGGLIGLVIAGWIYARLNGKSVIMLADIGAVAATPGLFFGRIGNFINAELYGRPTTVPWGMVFPGGGFFPRHPSQLYEAFSEGILLFIILSLITWKSNTRGIVISFFLIIYGIMRYFLEFFREPDSHLGFVMGSLSMGQVLCMAMIAAGTALLAYSIKVRHGFPR